MSCIFSCQTKQEYKPSWPRCGRASPWVDPPCNWLDDELTAQWVGQQRLQRFLLEFELLRAWEGNKACENNLNFFQLESKLLIISNISKEISPGQWLEQTRTRSRELGLEEAVLLSLVFHRLTFPFHPSHHVDLLFRVLSLHLGFPRTSVPHPPEMDQ